MARKNSPQNIVHSLHQKNRQKQLNNTPTDTTVKNIDIEN